MTKSVQKPKKFESACVLNSVVDNSVQFALRIIKHSVLSFAKVINEWRRRRRSDRCRYNDDEAKAAVKAAEREKFSRFSIEEGVLKKIAFQRAHTILVHTF